MSVIHTIIETLLQKCDEGTLENFDEHLKNNVMKSCIILRTTSEHIQELEHVKNICQGFNQDFDSTRWKYICLSFHTLLSIENDPVLSVKQIKNIRSILEIIISLGLLPNLIPGVGIDIQKRSKLINKIQAENLSITEQYFRIRAITKGLLLCNVNNELKNIIISYHIGDLLAALCQLSFAPIKKPNEDSKTEQNSFKMSKEFWIILMKDREQFQNEFFNLLKTCYRPILIKEFMIMLGVKSPTTPTWLKRELTKILCGFLIENEGIICMIQVMFESDQIDMGAHWKQLETLVELIINVGRQNLIPDYFPKISKQILRTLKTVVDNQVKNNIYTVFIRMFLKSLNEYDSKIFVNEIFNVLIEPLRKDSNENELSYCIDVIHILFIIELNRDNVLPLIYLKPYVKILFRIYTKINNDTIAIKLKSILTKLIENYNENIIFSCILFDTKNAEIYDTDFKFIYSIDDLCNHLISLLENCDSKCQFTLFNFALNYLSDLYVDIANKIDLLNLENNEVFIDKITKEKLTCIKILETYSEKSSVIETIKKDPKILLNFISKILEFSKNNPTENYSDSKIIFIAIMLLSLVFDNIRSIKDNDEMKNILENLEYIENQSKNDELKIFIKTILKIQRHPGEVKFKNKETDKPLSEFEQALEELCSPLLPVRGHALMALGKLIKSGDAEAKARSQYLLCVFQENLLNDDSYIYLSAIGGLSELATAHPDIVIETLTEEFVNAKQNSEEMLRVRMNIGEILVRVTKNLGETAVKYKNELLNAFLSGTHDPDHLIRASSLSNLGEICHVLGYNLGSIVTDIIFSIHSIIETDKSVEVRRAAVYVARRLIEGLGADAIIFLKDSLLPLYRLLKLVYQNDEDGAARLQAQLALEELNSATLAFLKPQIGTSKNILKIDK